MLSRVADAVYWMSRYLERAENTARFLDVNWHLTLDLPDDRGEQWLPLVMTTGDHTRFFERYAAADKESVVRFLTFDGDYPNSIRSCLAAARENARTVREMIPSEMWEQINVFYHLILEAAKRPGPILDNPFHFCDEVKLRSQTVGGIAEEAMMHDEAWSFFRLGRLLERADKTSRLLDVKYFILLPSVSEVGTAMDYVQWGALLRAISGFQAYRHSYGKIIPDQVVQFLLLDHDFPRSVLYCLTEAQRCLHYITGTRIGYFTNVAEQRLGMICATLSFMDIDEVFIQGLHQFTDDLQRKMNLTDQAIQETFFALGDRSTPADGNESVMENEA